MEYAASGAHPFHRRWHRSASDKPSELPPAPWESVAPAGGGAPTKTDADAAPVAEEEEADDGDGSLGERTRESGVSATSISGVHVSAAPPTPPSASAASCARSPADDADGTAGAELGAEAQEKDAFAGLPARLNEEELNYNTMHLQLESPELSDPVCAFSRALLLRDPVERLGAGGERRPPSCLRCSPLSCCGRDLITSSRCRCRRDQGPPLPRRGRVGAAAGDASNSSRTRDSVPLSLNAFRAHHLQAKRLVAPFVPSAHLVYAKDEVPGHDEALNEPPQERPIEGTRRHPNPPHGMRPRRHPRANTARAPLQAGSTRAGRLRTPTSSRSLWRRPPPPLYAQPLLALWTPMTASAR